MYALHRESRRIVYMLHGRRNKVNLQALVQKVLSYATRRVYIYEGFPDARLAIQKVRLC